MKEKALFLRFPRHVVAIEDNTSLHLWYLQAFNDSHMLMSTLGAKNEDLTMKLLDSLRKYVRYEVSFEFLPSTMGCQGATNTNKQTIQRTSETKRRNGNLAMIIYYQLPGNNSHTTVSIIVTWKSRTREQEPKPCIVISSHTSLPQHSEPTRQWVCLGIFGARGAPKGWRKPHGTGGRVNKQLKRSNRQNEVKLTAWRSGANDVIPPRKINQIYLGYSTL